MEFYITASANGESGVLSVVGRCGDQPIRPGAEFRGMLKERPRRYPDEAGHARQIEACRDVRVLVHEVEAYGKTLDVLPANMTGVLRCVEYSVDLVPGGWILTDRCVSAPEAGPA